MSGYHNVYEPILYSYTEEDVGLSTVNDESLEGEDESLEGEAVNGFR